VSEQDGSDAVEEEPTPLHRVLELLVFAPVGLALTVAEDLPGLIDKGRNRFESDVNNARVVGQFVVTHGQREVVGRLGKLFHRDAADSATATDAPDATPAGGDADATESTTPPDPKPAADPADGIIVEHALAGYDTLSASQVVRRLESLGPDELRAIGRYEASHRNRRTILNRAGQILEAAEGNSAAPEPDLPGA
jgi:hypothetical protein